MSLKTLDLEWGPLHPIREVTHLFGCSADSLRDKCAAGEIDPIHIDYDKNGRPARYLIPEKAIRNWRKAHEVRSK